MTVTTEPRGHSGLVWGHNRESGAQGMLRATFGDTMGTAEPRGHSEQVWGHNGNNRAQGTLRATFGDTSGTAEPRGCSEQVWGHHGDIGRSLTSQLSSLSLVTVRSARSPRLTAPPPMLSMMKTSEEIPRDPVEGNGWGQPWGTRAPPGDTRTPPRGRGPLGPYLREAAVALQWQVSVGARPHPAGRPAYPAAGPGGSLLGHGGQDVLCQSRGVGVGSRGIHPNPLLPPTAPQPYSPSSTPSPVRRLAPFSPEPRKSNSLRASSESSSSSSSSTSGRRGLGVS